MLDSLKNMYDLLLKKIAADVNENHRNLLVFFCSFTADRLDTQQPPVMNMSNG
jgi:hypothetical protein